MTTRPFEQATHFLQNQIDAAHEAGGGTVLPGKLRHVQISNVEVEEGTYRFTSEAADAVDYAFIYGPEAQRVHEQFTELTGRSPLFARGLSVAALRVEQP